MRLIEINKVLYALGLEWHLKLTRLNKTQIRQQAGDDFDLYCLRPRQIGFIQSNQDKKALKAKSLTASLHGVESFFIALLTLNDIYSQEFYYIIAIQNDVILGLGDAVYSSKEEAEKSIIEIEDLVHSSAKKVLCHSHAESVEYLSQFLPRKRILFEKYVLQEVYSNKQNNKKSLLILGFISCIFLLYYALSRYIAYQETKSIEEAQLLFLQDLEARKAKLLAHPEELFEQAWQNKAYPEKTFLLCREELFQIPIIENGWALDNALCTNTNIKIVWEHKAQASFLDLPYSGTLTSPTVVTSNIKLKQEQTMKIVPFETLLKKDEVTNFLYQLTQNMGAKLTLSFAPKEVKEYKDLKMSIPAPWMKGRFSFDNIPASLLFDTSFIKELEKLPSIYLISIGYNNNNWSIKGEIYVQ